MNLFRKKKSRRQRMLERAVPAAKRAGATALGVTGTAVAVTAALTVETDERSWVSRGAHKLIGALDAYVAISTDLSPPAV